jgi:hypothetical protein
VLVWRAASVFILPCVTDEQSARDQAGWKLWLRQLYPLSLGGVRAIVHQSNCGPVLQAQFMRMAPTNTQSAQETLSAVRNVLAPNTIVLIGTQLPSSPPSLSLRFVALHSHPSVSRRFVDGTRTFSQ